MSGRIAKGAALVLTAVAMAGVVAAQSVEIVDPHVQPGICPSCHTSEPTPEEAAGGNYNLLGGDIDTTCHICHPYDCCRINSLKGHNHASGVDEWDDEKYQEPRTLPLYDGKITCSTCHFSHRQEDPGYKMVRIVEVKLDEIDWSGLCLDCHVGY